MNFRIPLVHSAMTAIAMVFIAGCATVVVSTAPDGTTLDKFAVVEKDFASRPATDSLMTGALPWKKATSKFTISRTDPIFGFPSGKSYFRIVALPADAIGKTLELRSYYSLDFPTTLFVGALMFLDQNGQWVADRVASEFKIVNGLNEHISIFEPIPANSSYVVIYTTPARLQERMNFMTYSMAGVIPAPSFKTHDTGFGASYEGILRLGLVDQK